jgi:hypothetical protein
MALGRRRAGGLNQNMHILCMFWLRRLALAQAQRKDANASARPQLTPAARQHPL